MITKSEARKVLFHIYYYDRPVFDKSFLRRVDESRDDMESVVECLARLAGVKLKVTDPTDRRALKAQLHMLFN